MMETKIILNIIEKGEILHYIRYVDDFFSIIRKRAETRIQEEMNSYLQLRPFIKFTFENMVNDELPFLGE